MIDDTFWNNPAVKEFMDEWKAREYARRTLCPECQFESSEGYEESHTSTCSRRPPR